LLHDILSFALLGSFSFLDFVCDLINASRPLAYYHIIWKDSREPKKKLLNYCQYNGKNPIFQKRDEAGEILEQDS
jgi:hypothetical protein